VEGFKVKGVEVRGTELTWLPLTNTSYAICVVSPEADEGGQLAVALVAVRFEIEGVGGVVGVGSTRASVPD
jgi:hypothetical protein